MTFFAFWLADRPSGKHTLIVELGVAPASENLSMPLTVTVRTRKGTVAGSGTLHNDLEPTILSLAPGSYVVAASACGGTMRIDLSARTTVVGVMPLGGRRCAIRRFE